MIHQRWLSVLFTALFVWMPVPANAQDPEERVTPTEKRVIRHQPIQLPRDSSFNPDDILQRFNKVLIPELNLGQLRLLIRARYLVDAVGLSKVQGLPIWDDHALISGTGIGGGNSLAECFTVPFLKHYFRPLVSVSMSRATASKDSLAALAATRFCNRCE